MEVIHKQVIDTQTGYEFILYDDSIVDRDGERILVSGINLENFRKNPLAFYQHEMNNYPIGIWDNVHVEGAKLVGTLILDRKTEKSNTVANLIEAGSLRAVSIGFRVLAPPEIEIVDAREVYIYPKTELIEASVVTIPSNPNAIRVKTFVNEKALQINQVGVQNAKSLIAEGKVDRQSSWEFTSEDGNEILGDNNWNEYAKWFLSIDPNANEETKARYKYPFGKKGKVYRSAIIAISQRAGQQKETEIFDIAGQLLALIDKEGKMEKIGREISQANFDKLVAIRDVIRDALENLNQLIEKVETQSSEKFPNKQYVELIKEVFRWKT